MSDHSELRRLAEAATPQNFDSAEEKSGNGHIECPHCNGQGEVELEADYLNYDSAAIGVQFYGIGSEFGAAEAYYRAANPAAVLGLISKVDGLYAQHGRDSAELRSLCEARDDARKERDQLKAENAALQQRLTVAEQRAGELEGLLRECQPALDKAGYSTWQIDEALKPAEEVEALGTRPVGCCCPPKGHTGIWAAAMCPVHFGLKRPGVSHDQ